jgi:hypothetical protein
MIALGDYIPAPSPTRSPKRSNKNSPTRSKIRTDQIKNDIKPVIFSDFNNTDENTENKENQPNSPNRIIRSISPLKPLIKKNQSSAVIGNADSDDFHLTTNLNNNSIVDDATNLEKNEQNAQSNASENDDLPERRIREIQTHVQPDILSEISPVSSPNTIISKLRNGQRVKDGMILMLTGQVDKRKKLLLGAEVCQYDTNSSLRRNE